MELPDKDYVVNQYWFTERKPRIKVTWFGFYVVVRKTNIFFTENLSAPCLTEAEA